MKNKKVILVGIIVLSLLCCAATAVGYLSYGSRQRQAMEDRPLVLIHTPLNRQQIPLGTGIMAHATARSGAGVSQIELWVDGEFIAVQESPTEEGISPLLLTSGWKPFTAGPHILVVRAISSSGVAGQATITVEVTEDEAEIVAEAPPAEEPADGVPSEDGAPSEDGEPSGDQAPSDGETPSGESPGDTPTGDEPSGGEPIGDSPGGDDGGDGGGDGSDDSGGGGDSDGGDGAPGDGWGEPQPPAPPGSGGGNPSDGWGEPQPPVPPGDNDGNPAHAWGEPQPVIPPNVGEPPTPLALSPDVLLGLGTWILPDFFLSIPFDVNVILPPIPEGLVALRVEALALETTGNYESVHCYIKLAEQPDQRYPDTDGNQATDESFAPLGGGKWDVAAHLEGNSAPTIVWPGDQALPITARCVGIAEGGFKSILLGEVEIAANWTEWDGVIHQVTSTGGKGSFTLDYRITMLEENVTRREKGEDPRMTPPTNLTRDRSGNLNWEYTPRGEDSGDPEAPIAGFRIHLNGTLQWVVPANARSTTLPGQWLYPPCDEEYSLTVTAYYDEGCPSDCRESRHSEPLVIQPNWPEGMPCGRRVTIAFETLTTGDLGNDGSSDPGDQGPVYGWFYANEEEYFFDGRCVSEIRTVGPCSEVGLVHYGEYAIPSLTIPISGRRFPGFTMDIPEGEDLTIRFNITDADTGNPDDLVCVGQDVVRYSNLVSSRRSIETDVTEPDLIDAPLRNRCIVTYSIQPSADSPVVEAGDPPPKPLLQVEGVRVDDANHYQVRVVNIGNADWNHEVKLELTRQSGEYLDLFLHPSTLIDVGEETTLDAGVAPERPMDVCVTPDPDNEVDEYGEEYNIYGTYRPYCPPLPDLVITSAMYDPVGQRLLVVVRNDSGHSLDNRDLDLFLLTPSTGFPVPDAWWEGTTINSWENLTVEWPPPEATGDGAHIDAQERRLMVDGYSIVVDPNDDIAESNEDNNRFEVPRAQSLRVQWFRACAPHYQGGTNRTTMYLNVDIVNGGPSQRVASWSTPELTINSWDQIGQWAGCWAGGDGFDSPYRTEPFTVMGDELVAIVTYGELEIRSQDYNLGTRLVIINPNDESQLQPRPSNDRCFMADERGVYEEHIAPTSTLGTLSNGPWASWVSTFGVCLMTD